jgi:hypothetical protein
MEAAHLLLRHLCLLERRGDLLKGQIATVPPVGNELAEPLDFGQRGALPLLVLRFADKKYFCLSG